MPPRVLPNPGSLNGEPGEEAESPGVLPFGRYDWQLAPGGPVPAGFPCPAKAAGAKTPRANAAAMMAAVQNRLIARSFFRRPPSWVIRSEPGQGSRAPLIALANPCLRRRRVLT